MTKCNIPIRQKTLGIAARKFYNCVQPGKVLTAIPLKEGVELATICLEHSVFFAVQKFIVELYDKRRLKNMEELEEMGLNPQKSVDLLKSQVCRCNNSKNVQMPFCRDCFQKLPAAIAKALYQRIGFGFEQAYKLACDTLDGK